MTMPALAVDYGHAESVFIHFDDLDAMGVVHNGRHPVLLERAISQYWQARGYGYADGRVTSPDVFHAVREFAITYLAPIRGTGEIAVYFWVEQLGETSATYGFRFLSADGRTVYAEGRRAIVRLDPATLRPTPWTDALRVAATTLLREPSPIR